MSKLQSDVGAAVREHWKAFLFEGILLVVLGLAAMILPPLASLAVTIFLGWMFLITGIAGLALTFWARQMPGFWWSLISAVLAIAAGIILLVKPVQGTLTLTIVVGAYFLAEGVTTIMYALEHRRELSERWSWLLVSGVLDILIAAMIIAGLPGSAGWAIGLLVGINLGVRRRFPDRHGAGRAQGLIRAGYLSRRFGDDRPERLRYRPPMITVAASNYWYFSFDSSLAVGGSRSI
jgi:uncharacterized membrane protein HdeD (DUF308 family)